nr:basic leucine zipper 1-like [Quercus suber]POE84100.1 g-box-binding factor 3 [Quercus suber]
MEIDGAGTNILMAPWSYLFQFTAKIIDNSDEAKLIDSSDEAKLIDNSDEAKRQRRKQANIESAKRSRKRKQDLMKNLEKEVEVLKNTALESSQVCQELQEKCDKAHFESRIAVIDYVTIPLLVYKTELQLRVIGCHPLNDPIFISMAKNAGLNLSDVRRSLLRAPTYPGKVGMQQVQNQNFPHTGLHGAVPGWVNYQ